MDEEKYEKMFRFARKRTLKQVQSEDCKKPADGKGGLLVWVVPAAVIYDRHKGNWEPPATTLIRECHEQDDQQEMTKYCIIF